MIKYSLPTREKPDFIEKSSRQSGFQVCFLVWILFLYLGENMIDGFVFDFDGLMIDTEIPRFDCWKEKFQEYGSTYTFKDWWKTIGTGPSAYDPAEDLYQRTQGKIDRDLVNKWVDEKTDELLENQPLLPGVETFIHNASQQGIKLALASSSPYEWVMPFLEKFDLVHYFEAILTARDVEEVKPDPALYQLAVQKLGLPSNSVMAFEDSLNGLKAAKAAGIFCTVVPNQITREMDLEIADMIVDSFDHLSVEEIRHFHLPVSRVCRAKKIG
jgi:putative hydrolase of the HAD superfamily